jgi:uncharacterized protein YkwD
MRDRRQEARGFGCFLVWTLLVSALGLFVLFAILALCTSTSFAQDTETVRFVGLLNGYRVANGLSPLAEDSRLVAAAEWFATDMLAHCISPSWTCQHTDSTGRAFDQRLRDFGYPCGITAGCGENIAGGTGGSAATADQVFAAWKASPSHNADMLQVAWKALGVARRCDAERNCAWSNEFGSQFPQQVATFTPAPTPVGTPTPFPPINPTIFPVLPTSTPTPVVPEPGTLVLFVSGLSVLLWRLKTR